MARVIRSDRAQEDLEEILAYLDSQSTQAADRSRLDLSRRVTSTRRTRKSGPSGGVRRESPTVHRLELRDLLSAS